METTDVAGSVCVGTDAMLDVSGISELNSNSVDCCWKLVDGCGTNVCVGLAGVRKSVDDDGRFDKVDTRRDVPSGSVVIVAVEGNPGVGAILNDGILETIMVGSCLDVKCVSSNRGYL